jgi:hypothetical protein
VISYLLLLFKPTPFYIDNGNKVESVWLATHAGWVAMKRSTEIVWVPECQYEEENDR